MTSKSWPPEVPFSAGGFIPAGSVAIHLQVDECVLDPDTWRCVRRGADHLRVCPDRLAEGEEG